LLNTSLVPFIDINIPNGDYNIPVRDSHVPVRDNTVPNVTERISERFRFLHLSDLSGYPGTLLMVPSASMW
jgi:hypothetical protein